MTGRSCRGSHCDGENGPQNCDKRRQQRFAASDRNLAKFAAIGLHHSAIFPPGSSTIGSAAVCDRTRSAHAAASCAIGGQVL